MDDIIKLFIYGYPVVGMYELLSKRDAPLNTFAHTAALSTPDTTFVPAPNNDTAYSRGWLDLRGGPVIIEAPDTADRFYSIQFLDMFSETLANVGRRTTGTAARHFAVTGPGWSGTLPEGCLEIRCPTVFALAFLRVLVQGEADILEVRDLQEQFAIRPFYEESRPEAMPPCKTRTAREFFETLGRILALSGQSGDADVEGVLANSDEMLERGRKEALQRIEEGGQSFGEQVHFWRVARKNIGNYGTDYLQRAVVWHKGALANQPQESLYPSTFQDKNGELLDGRNRYRLTFTQLPPVSQFWSLTVYRFKDAYLCQNPIHRYSIGDRTEGLNYGKNGSLTIYLQSDPPKDPEELANWLPVPEDRFYMTLRMYGPDDSAVNGEWEPPAVQRAGD